MYHKEEEYSNKQRGEEYYENLSSSSREVVNLSCSGNFFDPELA